MQVLTTIKKTYYPILLVSCLVVSLSCQQAKTAVEQVEAPISIEGLRQTTYASTLSFEKKLVGTKKYKADLWSYQSDSLKIFTLINTPKQTTKKYGVSTTTGKDWRPGDYYRGIPEAYAEKGFVAITPDYRGHNVSEGFEFTKTSYLASTYYAIDVLYLIAALSDLKNVNVEEIYYLGHSMGGDVGLKMLLATNQIKAASLWAPVAATIWEQALYYGKYYDENGAKTDTEKMTEYLSKMETVIEKLGFKYDMDAGDPIHFVNQLATPLIIHHSRRENSVPYMWSESLTAKLFKYNKPFEFYAYDSDKHLLEGENRLKAVERDIAFFNKK